jgi:Major Facilitator Superfamily
MDHRVISYTQLIRLPNMPALLAAACLCRLADRMFAIVIVFHALAAFLSPTIAGWVAFAAVAPGLMISPLAGALLDRAGAIRGIAADLAASATVALALAVCIWAGRATPPVVIILAAAYALSSPLSAAGIRVLLPCLVPGQALDRANALDTTVHAIVDVAGPSLAGALVGFAGSITAFLVIAIAYAAATICVALIRETSVPSPPVRGFLRQTLEGVGFVIRRPLLRGLAIGYALNMLTWGILWVAIPVSLAQSFHAGNWEWVSGLLWAGAGIAGGIGALVSGQFGMFGREVPGMTLCMLVTALAVASVAAGFGMPVLAFGLLLAGLMAGPIDVGVLTLRQRRTDPAHLGRVLAVSMSLNMSGFPIGTVLGGVLVAWSPRSAFLAAALASLLGAVATHALIPAGDDLLSP